MFFRYHYCLLIARHLGACCLGILTSAGFASAAPAMFWISTLSPGYVSSVAAQGMSNPDDETDSAYSTIKRFWFREGERLDRAAYLSSAAPMTLERLDASGQRFPVHSGEDGAVAQVMLEIPEMGVGNFYATRTLVRGQTRWIQLAKAEIVRRNSRERNIDPKWLTSLHDPKLPLEIVRERPDKERLYSRLRSGDTVDFTIYAYGKPLAGVPVIMLTEQGWQKKVFSDAQGKASFTLIRDYFPAWHNFLRRMRETFVVVADHETPEPGIANEGGKTTTHYQATLSGRYALSPHDYSSYAYGLGIVIFVTTFSGLAVYLYRRRRVKPFQEIRFDERI